MPLPVRLRLMVDFTDPNLLDEIRYELLEHQTACEVPKCTSQAVMPYRNDHSVIFICEPHDAIIQQSAANPDSKRAMNKLLSEGMYSGLLNKSYVHANNNSGFVLEELVEAHVMEGERRVKLAKQDVAAERRKIRKAINESNVRIGAPDEALIVARQAPTRSPATAVHTASIVAPATPGALSTAAPAQLPFPDFELM